MAPQPPTQRTGRSSRPNIVANASTRGRSTAAILEGLDQRSLFAAVTGFSLVDATTDLAVPGYESLEDGAVINLQSLPTRSLNLAATADASTGSVRLSLSGDAARLETAAPFALFGDSGPDYSAGTLRVGEHTLTATPYERMVGRTTRPARAGATQTIRFTVVDQPVVRLELYDARKDKAIKGYRDLRGGVTIDLANLPTRNLTIRATGAALSAGKVSFTLDDLPARTEYAKPYALFGDNGKGNLFGGALSLGSHTLVVRTATAGGASGFGSEQRLTFNVIDSSAAQPTIVPRNVWTTTFNAAGARPEFHISGGHIATTTGAASIFVNGRQLRDDEFVLRKGSIRLLAPLEAGANRVEISARPAEGGSRIRGAFDLWAGSTAVTVSAIGAAGGVNVIATLPNASVASETYVPRGGTGMIASIPDAPVNLGGTDVDGSTEYAGEAGDDDDAVVTPVTTTNPTQPTSPTEPEGPTDPIDPNHEGGLKIYTTISVSANTHDIIVPGTTPMITDGGAGTVFGMYVPGGEWLVGGWAGPQQEVDPAALEHYMSNVPVGSVYLSNSFEDKLGTKLEQIVTVLRAAHERGLVVGWYGLPGLRVGDGDAWRARNDAAMAALAPYVDLITPGIYFGDDAAHMSDLERAVFGEMLDESLRLKTTQTVVPTISPYTHDGRAVPVEKNLELIAMMRERGIQEVAVWTDRALTPHVKATLDALAAA